MRIGAVVAIADALEGLLTVAWLLGQQWWLCGFLPADV